jgi:glycosyltransferase involved in cell wall biosynthesis
MSTQYEDVVDVLDPARNPAHRNNVHVLASKRERAIRLAIVVEAAGGGVAVHVADLIRGLCAHGGVEVHLVAPAGARFDSHVLGDDVLSLCDSVHRINVERSVGISDLSAFAQLLKCLNQINPDIVHSHSSKAGALARVCFGGWKQVYTPHAIYTLNPYLPSAQRWFYGFVEKLLGRLRSDRIIAVSVDEACHLETALRIPAKRIETIFNGVSAPDLFPAKRARAVLGVPQDAIVVGFVGRFDFQKGVDRLTGVAQKLLDRGLKDVLLVAIGPGDFAAAAGIGESSLPANLRVVGRLADARRYFSAFDVFALPSRYEGFPYVLLEAMAACVPVVATKVSGAGELVEAEQIGFVVPNEDDVTLFSDAVEALVVDPALRARMRDNCKRAVERFSIPAMVDRTVELYARLLKESN